MSSQVLILQLALLGVVLESDVGLRSIGWFRVARPLIVVAAIAPTYLTSLPTTGHDVLFQVIGVLVGVALGAFVVSPLFVSVGFVTDYRGHWARWRRKPGRAAIVSRAGWGYAWVWIIVCVLRLFFAYGSQHIFGHALGTFLHNEQLSTAGLTNTLVFVSICMDLTRSAGLLIRRQNVRRRLGPDVFTAVPTGRSETSDRVADAGFAALSVGASTLGRAAGVVIGRRIDRETDRVRRREERSDRRRRRG